MPWGGINHVSLMVLSSISISGLLLWIVRSVVMDLCCSPETSALLYQTTRLYMQEFSLLVSFVFPSSWEEERCGESFFVFKRWPWAW